MKSRCCYARFFSGSFLNHLILKMTLLAGQVAAFVTRNRSWIQGVAGTLAMTLGFWGWTIQKPPTDFFGVTDNLFRTVQLITLQFPTDFKGTIPLPLQIARLAVPIVAVLASFQALVGSITRPARLALLPHSSGHIVVCGPEALTEPRLSRWPRGDSKSLWWLRRLAHRNAICSKVLASLSSKPIRAGQNHQIVASFVCGRDISDRGRRC